MSTVLSHVNWVHGAGELPFVPSAEWCSELRAQRIRCSHCDAIRQDAKEKLTAMVVERVPPRLPIGSVLLGGLILRSNLFELIGLEKLEHLCICLPVIDRNGVQYNDLRFFIEKVPRGKWRGSTDSRIGLCQECARLLYWPKGKRYLLRRYWDARDNVTVVDNQLLCTPDYFDDVLGPRFSSVRADAGPLADEPEDGLPADYNEMVAEIRRRAWTR